MDPKVLYAVVAALAIVAVGAIWVLISTRGRLAEIEERLKRELEDAEHDAGKGRSAASEAESRAKAATERAETVEKKLAQAEERLRAEEQRGNNAETVLGQKVGRLAEVEHELDEARNESLVLREQIEEARSRATGAETKVAELAAALDQAKKDEETQRQFFVRRGRETYETLKARLTTEHFPDRVEAMQGGEFDRLSPDAKWLVSEVEWWIESGGMDDKAPLHVLALLDYARGDVAQAEERLRAASRVSEDSLLWENLGDIERHLGKMRRAIDAWKHAVKGAKPDSGVRRKLGLALYNIKEFAGAAKHLRAAAQTSPDDLDLHLKASRALVETEEYARAADFVKSSIGRFSGSAELAACGIYALGKLKRFPEAAAAFDTAAAANPEHPELHVARGFALLEEGRVADGRACFQKALAVDAQRAEAHCGLGAAANREGEFDQALKHLQKATELKPDYADAFFAMKDSYEGLRNFNRSLEVLKTAVALKSGKGA